MKNEGEERRDNMQTGQKLEKKLYFVVVVYGALKESFEINQIIWMFVRLVSKSNKYTDESIDIRTVFVVALDVIFLTQSTQ